MREKNIYRADDILIRTAVITGVICGLYVLNAMSLYQKSQGEEDVFMVLAKALAAASVPLIFGLAGFLVRRVEKKYIEIWNILERSVEVSFSDIESTTGFSRTEIEKAVRVINRKSGPVYLIDPVNDLVYDGRLSGRVAGSSLCPGCGGSIDGLMKLSFTDAPECPNCGRKIDLSKKAAAKEELLRAIREEDLKAQNRKTGAEKVDFKLWVFVVLVMFFWPAAIWYIIKKYPLRKI